MRALKIGLSYDHRPFVSDNKEYQEEVEEIL
jgi:hypothetical protein